jgi:uncharacterized protein
MPGIRDVHSAAIKGRSLLSLHLHAKQDSRPFPGSARTLRAVFRMRAAVDFFIYETIKILLLLVIAVFAMGIVRSFFAPERTRALLAGRREAAGNLFAALLGVVTPFCSCSAVPLFIGFVTAGVPLGVTFSFLVSAPMVNEVAVVLLFALFGWRIALLYTVLGLTIAVASGWTIGRLHLERYVEPWVTNAHRDISVVSLVHDSPLEWRERVQAGRDAVRDIFVRVWPFVVAGIAVGALIHGYVPQEFFASFMGESAWWAVPVAVILGIPMYANAAGIIPIVQALLDKGAALGTVLAFMMAVVALSLPEMVILRRVLRPPLLAAFVVIVGAGILLVGYLFNMVL